MALHGVGKLDWGFGPAGAEAVVTGIDVLVIKGDKIGAIYTFLRSAKEIVRSESPSPFCSKNSDL
jgi:hypothetical protein